jgi:hypothetical protein
MPVVGMNDTLLLPLHVVGGLSTNEVLLDFDKDNSLLLKEEWDHHDLHCEFFDADSKMVNGVAVARKLTWRTTRKVSYRSEIEFAIVDRLDARLFQKP